MSLICLYYLSFVLMIHVIIVKTLSLIIDTFIIVDGIPHLIIFVIALIFYTHVCIYVYTFHLHPVYLITGIV